MPAFIPLLMGAGKALGSMAAWELGTQALMWYTSDEEDIDADSPEISNYDEGGNFTGAIAAGAAAGSIGVISKAWKRPSSKNKLVSQIQGNQRRALQNTGSSHAPGSSIVSKSQEQEYAWIRRKHKGKQEIAPLVFKAPKIKDAKGFKVLAEKAMKLMPKTKKGKFGAAMLLLSAISTGIGALGKDEPSNALGDRLLKNALLNKAYEGSLEDALGIDYSSRIQKNLAMQVNRLLKTPDISAEDAGKLVTDMEADLQNAGMTMMANSFQMYKLRGGSSSAYIESSKEYRAIKRAKEAITREADIIRGTGTEEEKNDARHSIMQIKKALLGQDDKVLQNSIRITNDYLRNAIAMRQVLMGTVKKKGSTPIVNASLLKEFHTMIIDWDSYSEEEQDQLSPMKNYIESLIPKKGGTTAGPSIKDILMAKQG